MGSLKPPHWLATVGASGLYCSAQDFIGLIQNGFNRGRHFDIRDYSYTFKGRSVREVLPLGADPKAHAVAEVEHVRLTRTASCRPANQRSPSRELERHSEILACRPASFIDQHYEVVGEYGLVGLVEFAREPQHRVTHPGECVNIAPPIFSQLICRNRTADLRIRRSKGQAVRSSRDPAAPRSIHERSDEFCRSASAAISPDVNDQGRGVLMLSDEIDGVHFEFSPCKGLDRQVGNSVLQHARMRG